MLARASRDGQAITMHGIPVEKDKRFKKWLKRSSQKAPFGIRHLEYVGVLLKRAGVGQNSWAQRFVDLVLWPFDYLKVRRSYRLVFGHNPRVIFPRTFNDYIQYAKLFRRKREYVVFADKLAVRGYVAKAVGERYLPKLYWAGTRLADARTVNLPSRFVIKANHLSGRNLLVPDASKLEWTEAEARADSWLCKDQSRPFAEWQYRWIDPKLFIEEFLGTSDGQAPYDYKFFCFNGRAEFVVVDFDRYTEHTQLLLDRDFSPLPVLRERPRYQGPLIKPNCFQEMLELAEALAGQEPFLRVDLYALDKPIFGEITVSPGAGLIKFNPESWDLRLGSLIGGSRRSSHPAVNR